MMGLYLLFVKKETRRGLIVCLLSIAYFALVVGVVMPFLMSSQGNELIALRYSHLGGGVWEMVSTALFQPWKIISSLIQFDKIVYLIVILLPVIYLPFLSLEIFLLSMPSFLVNLLSLNPIMYFPFFYYYTAPILPFVIISTMFSLYKLKKRNSPRFGMLAGGLIVSSLFTSLLYSPAPYSNIAKIADFRISDNAKKIKEIKKLIPTESSLSVQNNIGAHFSQREYIYTFPFRSDIAEFVLIDIYDTYENPQFQLRHNNFIFQVQMIFEDYYNEVVAMFNNPSYGVYFYSGDGWLIFKRGYDQEKNHNAKEMFESRFAGIRNKYRKLGI